MSKNEEVVRLFQFDGLVFLSEEDKNLYKELLELKKFFRSTIFQYSRMTWQEFLRFFEKEENRKFMLRVLKYSETSKNLMILERKEP